MEPTACPDEIAQPPDVELIEVSKHFKEVVAVDRVSMTVVRGEFISLLGPSGCGKTTTLRMIAGLESPTSGEILLQGQSALRIPPYQRPTNMVFQQYALFPHMTVFDNVAYGLTLLKMDKGSIRNKVTELLNLVQLSGLENRYPHQLSGGQQQRVALGRGLARDPAVLLLDEPLGSLDLVLRREMQIELKKLQQKVGISFVYVTHDQEEALAMSDRIAVMHQGRIVQMASSRELYERPATRFVAEFVGENNVLPVTIKATNVDGVVLDLDGSLVFAPADSPGQAGQEVSVCVRADRIRVAGAAQACRNQLHARLLQAVFRGTTVKWLVQLPAGLEITISTPIDESVEQPQPGGHLMIGWNPADMLILVE
jgi:spermidine/putrescine transport system ATP-binding protein